MEILQKICLVLLMTTFLTSCSIINKRSMKERYIKSNNVNVRSESQKNSSVLFQLDKGDRVEIGPTKDGYTEILKDGIHQGFVHEKLISFSNPWLLDNMSHSVNRVQPDTRPRFSSIDICKSGISKIFGRQPDIMNGEQYGDVIYITYTRGDGTVWKNKCTVRGNKIMWGTEEGRWRNGPFDEEVSFTIRGNKITVTEGGSSKTFNKNEF
jgi:hypothetical protein